MYDLRRFGKHLWPKMSRKFTILMVIKFVCSDMETDNITNYNIICTVIWRQQPELNECRKWRQLPAPSCNKHENRNLTKWRAAFTFESIHVRSLQIYKYFMVAKYYIHNDTPCSKSRNDFCSFRCVIWLLTQCFQLLSFLWPPYEIGQAIIFLPCGFFLSIFFFFLA